MSYDRIFGFLWGSAFGVAIGGVIVDRDPALLMVAAAAAFGCAAFGKSIAGRK